MGNWKTWAIIALSLAIAAPLTAPYIAAPLGTQNHADEVLARHTLADNGINDTRLNIVTVDGLTLPGGKGIVGYVNMLSTDDTIYLTPFTNGFPFWGNPRTYGEVVLHEYSHILQKRLITANSTATGYEHVAKLMELNDILGHDATEVSDTAGLDAFTGLEVNADCVASISNPIYVPHYFIRGDTCTADQEAAASAIRAGQWPTTTVLAQWGATIGNARATAAALEITNTATTLALASETKTVTSRGEYCAILDAHNATC